MDRVEVTSTQHLLNFLALSPADFERLCLGLMTRRRGYERAEHFGAAGGDRGRDVVVYRVQDGEPVLVYVQCKRLSTRPGKKLLLDEVDKILEHVEKKAIEKPAVILFLVTQNLSGDLRGSIRGACKEKGFLAEFLGLIEIDEEVHRNEDLMLQFFSVASAAKARRVPFDFVTPHHLGPSGRPFINRSTEMEALCQELPGEWGCRVFVACGPPGVGKSRLVKEWAVRHLGEYPDGQLYVDFRRFRDVPTGVLSEALRFSLEAMGCPPKDVPSALADRSALYRTITAGKRLMIVLDHVEEVGEFEGMLPDAPEACLVVTSATDLGAGSGGRVSTVVVDPLEPDHARELLFTLAGREPQGCQEAAAAEEILEYCEGSTVALEVCGLRVHGDVGASYSWVADSLTSEKTRLKRLSIRSTSLSVVLGAAYQALDDDLARAFRLVSLAPPMETWDQVSAVLDVDSYDAREIVNSLSARRLIEVSVPRLEEHVESCRPVQVNMGTLLRLYGRQLALSEDASESNDLVARLADYAAAKARQIDRAVSPERLRIDVGEARADLGAGPRSGADALRFFALERRFLLEVLEHAESAGLDVQACQIADALWPSLFHRGFDRDIVFVYELAVKAAARLGHPAAEARLRSLLARGQSLLGRYEEAGRQIRAASDMAQATGDRWLHASCMEFEGDLLLQKGDPQGAIEILTKARELFPTDCLRGKAIQDHLIGKCFAELGDWSQAARAHERALQFFVESNDHVFLARSGWRLAHAYAQLGDVDSALRWARVAVDEGGLWGEYYAQGRALWVLAAHDDGPTRAATLRECVRAFRQANDEVWLADAERALEAAGA